MAKLNPTIAIITLNINAVNILIKRRRLSDWIKRPGPTICCVKETHFRFKDTNRLKVKGWKKKKNHSAAS